jgi:hypothetical protein
MAQYTVCWWTKFSCTLQASMSYTDLKVPKSLQLTVRAISFFRRSNLSSPCLSPPVKLGRYTDQGQSSRLRLVVYTTLDIATNFGT